MIVQRRFAMWVCASLLTVFVAAPAADARKKKKSADTTEQPAPPPADAAPPTPPVEDSPPPPPPPEIEAPPPVEKPAAPAAAVSDDAWKDPTEYPHERELFLGIRYRGTIVPRFILGLFLDEGRTVFLNSVGIELDKRIDGMSVIPNLTYAEYGLSDTLFLQKGMDANNAGFYSYVNSSLKAIYLGVDVLWSSNVHANVDIEYGIGVGVGYLFGDLIDNYVYASAGGQFTASNGTQYAKCQTVNDGPGCSPADHTSNTAKVGGYVEPNWFNGGPIPTFYARIAPTLGVRIKPIRDLEARVQIGISLTEGFFFAISANVRIPHDRQPDPAPTPSRRRKRTPPPEEEAPAASD